MVQNGMSTGDKFCLSNQEIWGLITIRVSITFLEGVLLALSLTFDILLGIKWPTL